MNKNKFLLLLAAGAAVLAVPALGQALKDHNAKADVLVNADRIEVQDRADRAIFSGNVVVQQGNMTLTAGRLTVAYSGAGGGVDIDRIDASGGVRVVSPSESARGDFAVYDLNRKIVTLVGNVHLDQGRNQLSGGRLVLDLNSGRAVVDGSAVGGSTAPGTEPSGSGRVSGRFTVSGKN